MIFRLNWTKIGCWLVLLVALVIFQVSVFEVGMWIENHLKVQAASKVGSWIGLRIPVYDNVKKGYWYVKIEPSQFQIAPDPAGTSDGILSLKDGFTAGGVRYQMPTVPPAPDQSFDAGRANEQMLSCSVPVQGVSTCVWR
jgi:hypothetical protein